MSRVFLYRCGKCHGRMSGVVGSCGACACGGLIEADPANFRCPSCGGHLDDNDLRLGRCSRGNCEYGWPHPDAEGRGCERCDHNDGNEQLVDNEVLCDNCHAEVIQSREGG